MGVKSFLGSLLVALVLPGALGIFGAFFVPALRLRQAHAALSLDRGLAPRGDGLLKDLFGFALLNVPKLQRGLTALTQSDASAVAARRARIISLEGFHDAFELAGSSNEMRGSEDFAENFYFWLSQPSGETDFLATLRLSFFGRDGSHVVPWFTIVINDVQYSLPADFEEKAAPHLSGDARKIVVCEEYGTVEFTTIEPMKLWVLEYKGVLHDDDGNAVSVDAKFELSFTPSNVFYYNADWSEMAGARAMSPLTWDVNFWRNLTSQNQERYASASTSARGVVVITSQVTRVIDSDPETGIPTTTVVENATETYEFPSLKGSRDHNFGIRKWTFITRYVWWPPLVLDSPLEDKDGNKFEALIGSLVNYGNTFEEFPVGGLVGNADKLSFSHASFMKDFAPDWIAAGYPGVRVGIGEANVPSTFAFEVGLADGAYILQIRIAKRGKKSSLWEHSFYMKDGVFEINEAMTFWELKLVDSTSGEVVSATTATGLLEFGANLVGFNK